MHLLEAIETASERSFGALSNVEANQFRSDLKQLLQDCGNLGPAQARPKHYEFNSKVCWQACSANS